MRGFIQYKGFKYSNVDIDNVIEAIRADFPQTDGELERMDILRISFIIWESDIPVRVLKLADKKYTMPVYS